MSRRYKALYLGVLAVCFLVSVTASWTQMGIRIDNDVYDFLFTVLPSDAGPPLAVVLGIDEETLRATPGGTRSTVGSLLRASVRYAWTRPAVS